MKRRRILVIGGGVAGAACAWALAERSDHEIVVLERESQLAAHSTSKNAGILRTLTEDEATTSLALETAAFLSSPPPGFAEVPLVDPVGLILISKNFSAARVEAWRQRKREGSVSSPTSAELALLAPHFAGHRDDSLFVHDEGHIDTAALFEGFIREARRNGVRFETGAEVLELATTEGRVHGARLADGRELDADVVLIAAGGWAGRLGRTAGSAMRFEPRRRHLLVTAPDAEVNPRWPVLWSEPDAFYVKPESGGLMVCACDQDVIDPDHCSERPEVRELIAERVGELLPALSDARAAHFWAGMRTFSEDTSFTVGFDADVEGLFWVAGLGGHGMSTSVGVGRFAAAALAGEAQDPTLVHALSPARFSRTTSC